MNLFKNDESEMKLDEKKRMIYLKKKKKEDELLIWLFNDDLSKDFEWTKNNNAKQ